MSDVASHRGGSPSLEQPDYWWYRARARLLRTVFDPFLASAGTHGAVLDVGSADGPADFWAGRSAHVVPVDPDPRGLRRGGVCAQLPELPFEDSVFDFVTAFDVIEHCADEQAALHEIRRVLKPGGMLLMSVPAYQWAWTDFDVANGHHRRYTRRRAVRAVERSGFVPRRATHAFSAVFPAFAAQRLGSRLTQLRHGDRPEAPADVVSVVPVARPVERLLLHLCQLDERVLSRHDLPFGSSVLVAAEKPGPGSSASRAGSAGGTASAASES